MPRNLLLTATAVATLTLATAATAQTAQTAPQATAQTEPPAASQATLARNLAATCATCHGTNGQARGSMRQLAGMPAPALIALFEGFRNGSREATVMHQIARGYTDDQLRLIASHFAGQERAR